MTDHGRSLLAEMALQFGVPRELLATSSLGLLLERSSICRTTLAKLVPADLPDALTYRTEAIDPGVEGRPDVVGALGGERHIIIEGKFWAGLTAAQPEAYIDSLTERGVLLIVAPHMRFPTIGAELRDRLEPAGSVEGDLRIDDSSAPGLRSVRVGARWVCLVSWRMLLGRFKDALLDADDRELAADVDQLAGLCALEDDEAFLPLTASDLSNPTPLRTYQFKQLVDRVIEKAEVHEMLSRRNLRNGGGKERYVRFAAVDNMQVGLAVDFLLWARRRTTPLWLELAVEPNERLTEMAPSWGYKGRPVAPLTLPLGVEHEHVVDAVVAQIEQILDRAKGCRPTLVLGGARAAVANEDQEDGGPLP